MVKFIVNGGKGFKNILISIGLTLIIVAMLVFLYPKVFAYVFAGVVGLLGVGALLKGITSRPSPPPQNPGNTFDRYGDKTEDGSYQEVDD